MLPNIRAVAAAIIVAIALLMGSFGLVATYRVAQESRSAALHTDLVQRGRATVTADATPRAVLIVDTPAPVRAGIVPVVAIEETSVPEIAVQEILADETPPAPAPVVLAAPPAAEPPMGGPLPEQIAAIQPEPTRDLAAEAAAKNDAKNDAKAAARKARAARIARQRRAAAQRAAQAKREQENAAPPFGSISGQ